MKLTRNGSIVLSGLFAGTLLLSGVGFAQSKVTEAKYQEQTKQMQLYKQELKEVQAELKENASYKAKYECIQVEKNQLQEELNELSKWSSLGTFRITAYWNGEDEYGALTSTGVKAQVNHTIAVDPEIIPYGSEIKIDGQIYVAEDCGGAVKNNVIDVWVESKNNSFGVKYTEVFIKR